MALNVDLSRFAVGAVTPADRLGGVTPRLSTAPSDRVAATTSASRFGPRLASNDRSPERGGEVFEAALAAYGAPRAARGGVPANAYDRSIPASIRTNNPGAMWYSPSSQAKYGVLGRQNLNDGLGQGNNIAMFPTPEAGAAAQFDLLNRYGERGWDLRRAITTWSGGNSSNQYLNRVAGRLGVSPNARLSDIMAHQTQATALAQYMAHQEAGRSYPMTDTQWASAWQMYQQQTGGSPSSFAAAKPMAPEPAARPVAVVRPAASPATELPASTEGSAGATSVEARIAHFLLTLHEPPERAADGRTAKQTQTRTRPLPGAWYHA